MNRRIVSASLAAVMAVTLTACSGGAEKAEITTIPAETTVSEAAAEQTTTVSEEQSNAPETQAAAEETAASDDDYLKTASELLVTLSRIDHLDAGDIEEDTEVKYDRDGAVFFKVTDPQFSTTDDIRRFIGEYLTGELAERYSDMFDEQYPVYIDVNGELFAREQGRGCGFGWITDENNMPVTSLDYADENEYGVLASEMLFEDIIDDMEITIVREDGRWKLSSLNYVSSDAPEDIYEIPDDTALYADDAFIGTWVCGRASMNIYIDMAGYHVVDISWADSAYVSNEWHYVCGYISDSESLVSESGYMNVLTYSDEEADVDIKTTEGLSAEFFVGADGIMWVDHNENAGEDMRFEKID